MVCEETLDYTGWVRLTAQAGECRCYRRLSLSPSLDSVLPSALEWPKLALLVPRGGTRVLTGWVISLCQEGGASHLELASE